MTYHKARQSAYRTLFRSQLDKAAIDDIRLALGQSQPLGNKRFYARIEKLTGQRHEARARGRPRTLAGQGGDTEPGQEELVL